MNFFSGMVALCRDFSEYTTAHGIPWLGAARSHIVRIMWTIIFIGAVAAFIIQLVQLLTQYYSYPTNVKMEETFETRFFPAVTVCNMQPYNDAVLKEDPDFEDIETLMADWERIVTGNFVQFLGTAVPGGQNEPDEFALAAKMMANMDTSDPSKLKLDVLPLLRRTTQIAIYQAAKLYINERHKWDKIIWNLEKNLIMCTYGRSTCSIDDFKMIYDPTYGACYTFNVADRVTGAANYTSSRAGADYGLSMLLKMEQQAITPMHSTGTLRVAIHDPDTVPFPDALAYNAAVGSINDLAVRYTRLERQGPPYSQCVDASAGRVATTEGGQSVYYNGTYSTEACFRSCMQDQAIEACGCYAPNYAMPPDTDVHMCGLEETECLLEFTEKELNLSTCACDDKCNLTTYSVTITQSYWPQTKSAPQECANASLWRWKHVAPGCQTDESKQWRWELTQQQFDQWNDKAPPEGEKCDHTSDCLDEREWNYMVVQVFYETMGYTKIVETPAMTSNDFVSMLGGLFGLWIGCSMMSLLEFVGLAAALLCYCGMHVKFMRNRGITPEELHQKDLDDINAHLAKHAAGVDTPRSSAAGDSGASKDNKAEAAGDGDAGAEPVDPYNVGNDNSTAEPPPPV